MKKLIFCLFLSNYFICGYLFAEPFVVHEYSENSTNNSKSGYFSSIIDIRDGLNYCYINKLITSDDWFLLAKDLGDIMFFS